MRVTEEDFFAIIDVLNLLHRPADHGCRFDFGDKKTRQDRVGRIIDNLSATARALLEQAAIKPGKTIRRQQLVQTTVH